MGLTNFPNGLSSFGIPVLGSSGVPAMFGNYFFVDFVNGSDGNSGKDTNHAFKTLSKAYATVTSGNNDVVCVNGNSSVGDFDAVEEDTMITWATNKSHVVGLGAFGATDQSPRIIFSTAGKTSEVAAVLKVTGWANTFTNLRINSWSTATAGVTALWDAGEATTYTNCQFNMFENLDEATSHDVEARGDSTTWRNCKIGADTLSKTAASSTVMLIKGTGGSARMKNNVFEDCYFSCQTTQTTMTFIKVYDTNSLAFTNIWKNCIMMAPVITSTSAVVPASAVTSVAGLAEGQLLFVRPATNATSVCDGADQNTRVLVVGSGDATTTAIGVAVTPT